VSRAPRTAAEERGRRTDGRRRVWCIYASDKAGRTGGGGGCVGGGGGVGGVGGSGGGGVNGPCRRQSGGIILYTIPTSPT